MANTTALAASTESLPITFKEDFETTKREQAIEARTAYKAQQNKKIKTLKF